MTCIFYLSCESAETSSQTSAGLIETVVETFVPSYKEMPEEVKTDYISSLQETIRTLAHFTIFGALGVTGAGFVATFKGKFYFKLIFTQAFCSLYALSDEYHQTFSEGRSFQLIDICIDSLGAFCGIIAVFLIALVFAEKEGINKVKKRDLLKQIENLTNKLLEADEAIKSLKDEIMDRDQQIRHLKDKENADTATCVSVVNEEENSEIQDIIENESQTKQINYEDFDFANQTDLKKDEDINNYAVKVISRIITESVKIGCVLASSQNPNKKELLNLALGRTEVAKNEIYLLLNTNLCYDEIKKSIDNEEQQVTEYYKSIFAQL